MERLNYTNHSGGADGSDTEWEIQGNKYEVKTIAYSFKGHKQNSKNQCVLTPQQLNEGADKAKEAAKKLHRPWSSIELKPYVKNLISRNWFQVKGASAIYAIGKFVKGSKSLVDGGTGWAVQMAIDNNKPVYLFEQNENVWYEYSIAANMFVVTETTPALSNNFAGIGTREINENGKRAIKEIYEKTIGKL